MTSSFRYSRLLTKIDIPVVLEASMVSEDGRHRHCYIIKPSHHKVHVHVFLFEVTKVVGDCY